MSIGTSGRIVIEVETDIKRKLYSALNLDGMTLKEWFLQSAEHYMLLRGQIPLPFSVEQEMNDGLLETDKKNET